MTWRVIVQNNTGRQMIAPAASTWFSGTQAIVSVPGLGMIQLTDIGHVGGGPHYWAVQVTSGKYSARWYYDGGGECTLTLNADGTFVLEGQGQTLRAQISGTVPPTFQLPMGHPVYVNAFTNAGYLQRVTLTVNEGGVNQWQGNGEGNHQMVSTSFVTPKSGSGTVNATCLIEYSADNGTAWHPSTNSPVGQYQVAGYNQLTLVSEDGVDQDYNDTAVLLSWWRV